MMTKIHPFFDTPQQVFRVKKLIEGVSLRGKQHLSHNPHHTLLY